MSDRPNGVHAMAKFALGEVVADDKRRTFTVRAAFLSKEGQQHYAVEMDGVINFVEEAKLMGAPSTEIAA